MRDGFVPSQLPDTPIGKTDIVKFVILKDLGIVTVPDDYIHATRLAKFQEEYQSSEKDLFRFYNNDATDQNFPNPSRVLKPGDKFCVRVFQQIVDGATTSEERMAFLATQKAIYTGAQGASLVSDQKRYQLPKGKWSASYDEPDRLLKDANGHRRVPLVLRYPGGDFGFDLGYFELVWRADDIFFCFTEVEKDVVVSLA